MNKTKLSLSLVVAALCLSLAACDKSKKSLPAHAELDLDSLKVDSKQKQVIGKLNLQDPKKKWDTRVRTRVVTGNLEIHMDL